MRHSSQLTFILLLVAAVCCSGCRPLADFAFDDSSDEAVLARITLAWIPGLRQAQVGRGERSGFFRKATILHESIP